MHPFWIALPVLVVFAPPPVLYAQAPDRIPDAVRTGLQVSVVDERGVKTDGRVAAVSDDAIRVSVGAVSEEIPVTRIVRIEELDSLRNGALSGLVLGVSFGVLGGVAGGDQHHGRGTAVLVSTIGNGIIWTALGTAIDAIFDHRRTLYQRGGHGQTRVTPVVAPGVRGATVSVAW